MRNKNNTARQSNEARFNETGQSLEYALSDELRRRDARNHSAADRRRTSTLDILEEDLDDLDRSNASAKNSGYQQGYADGSRNMDEDWKSMLTEAVSAPTDAEEADAVERIRALLVSRGIHVRDV